MSKKPTISGIKVEAFPPVNVVPPIEKVLIELPAKQAKILHELMYYTATIPDALAAEGALDSSQKAELKVFMSDLYHQLHKALDR